MSEKKSIPKEIRATVAAWFTSDYSGPQDLLRDPEYAVTSVTFSNCMDMAKHGWTLAGEADIVLRPLQEQQLIESKVDSLRKQKSKVLADAQAQATEIERQINTLLCLSFDQPTEAQP